MVEHEDHGLRLDFELPAQRGIGFVDLDGSLCSRGSHFMHIKCHAANAKKEEEH